MDGDKFKEVEIQYGASAGVGTRVGLDFIVLCKIDFYRDRFEIFSNFGYLQVLRVCSTRCITTYKKTACSLWIEFLT